MQLLQNIASGHIFVRRHSFYLFNNWDSLRNPRHGGTLSTRNEKDLAAKVSTTYSCRLWMAYTIRECCSAMVTSRIIFISSIQFITHFEMHFKGQPNDCSEFYFSTSTQFAYCTAITGVLEWHSRVYWPGRNDGIVSLVDSDYCVWTLFFCSTRAIWHTLSALLRAF